MHLYIINTLGDFSAAMVGLPGVVVMDRSDLTSPEIHKKVEEFMAGRKADIIMR